MKTVELPNTQENRQRLTSLNKTFNGPLVLPKRGGQPKADRAKLLEWWNSLEERFRESQQRQIDTQATLKARHNYGRDETVLPDISGHIKKRRRKRPRE